MLYTICKRVTWFNRFTPQLGHKELNWRNRMTTRKKYSKEFKLDAISLVNEQGYNNAEAPRDLGIIPSLLGKWIREAEKGDDLAFRGNGKLTPEQLEIRQLNEENRKWIVKY